MVVNKNGFSHVGETCQNITTCKCVHRPHKAVEPASPGTLVTAVRPRTFKMRFVRDAIIKVGRSFLSSAILCQRLPPERKADVHTRESGTGAKRVLESSLSLAWNRRESSQGKSDALTAARGTEAEKALRRASVDSVRLPSMAD